MQSKSRVCKAKNPHNQFLFDYFQNQKMKCLSTGRDKLMFGYQKIIAALQKYPVPILTEDQASQLQGVGQKTSVMIVKLINQQYANDQNIALEVNDAVLYDCDEMINTNSCSMSQMINTNSCPVSLLSYREELLPQVQRLDFDEFRPKKPRADFLAGLDQTLLMKRVGGEGVLPPSKASKAFVPNKTQKSMILALQAFNLIEQRSYATRREIKRIAQSEYSLQIANWDTIEGIEKNGIISKCSFGDEIKYCLSDMGLKVAEQLKSEFVQCPVEVNDLSNIQIILLVDSRERFQSNNRQIIYEKLSSLHGIKCRLANLPVGDFLWIAKCGSTKFIIYYLQEKEFVLDCIVERKTLSDLSHSITDKRYNDQKYRLRNCGLTRAFYLIEGGSSSHLQVPRAVVEKAIRQTQVRDGFLIQQTENLEESLMWISRITRSLVVRQESLTLELHEFTANNCARAATVKQVWGCMISTISGAGQEVTKALVGRWPTPMSFYEELNAAEDKVSLLQDKVTGSTTKSKVKMNNNVAKLLEILFTMEQYPDTI